ncbi:DUF402 domain-containing protein [Paenibacillus sp. UMB4589-SE434]|uniref:DUF402 domain-containing protein n=1 Tax=Paenibacillus sp. UMB4589-SE434 TaxID=3046314 RepID=UPI002549F8DD|nr:DUF402 domain-containing protein [Paenibacillus sp. UMB4589-SE434]MDK8182764.1 DUF402 domain-containing protein [Paenibacillus sp. UMB4589-SE434]
MDRYEQVLVKSFKHDGHLHRMWLENWIVPQSKRHPLHACEDMRILINSQTPIQEADGKQWLSKVPAVTFFIPQQWFNVVALIEEHGVRYYCNVASPYYECAGVYTYIDYDLDVIRHANGHVAVVDRDEYDHNRLVYRYSELVERKVSTGLEAVMERIREGRAPFQDEAVCWYFEQWKLWMSTEGLSE